MNINTDTAVLAATGIVSVCGFIITSGLMLKGNKKGFEMIDLKINNLMQVLGLEMSALKDDIKDIDESLSGVKEQLKTEIYPRLNNVEKLSEKNCKVQEMHMRECDRRHA